MEKSDYLGIYDMSPEHILQLQVPGKKGKVSCHYNSWVRTVLSILGLGFISYNYQLNLSFDMRDWDWNVEYVSWDDYKEAFLAGKGDRWAEFKRADLIFGGMDFSCDFL
jgi:hypothetical protein